MSKRGLYNEDLKLSFIRQQTNSITMAEDCELLFRAFAPYEESWGADLCTRTKEELSPVFDSLVGMRAKSKFKRLTILKSYVRWCVLNQVPGAIDGASDMSVAGLGKIKTMTVKGPTQLQKYLNEICDPESEETVDNIYRCYYWMAFGGIPEEEILDVKCSEISFEDMEIHHGDIIAPLYRESIPAFKNAVRLGAFRYKHPLYSKDIVRPRAPGDTVIRGIRSAPSTSAMRVELSRRSRKAIEDGKTNIKLSYYRAWISGLFYRMYEQEELGIPADFTEAAENYTKGKAYKLDNTKKTQNGIRREIANDYMEDYERWKAAFMML